MASAPLSASQTSVSPASGAPQSLQSRLNALTRRRNSVVMGRQILRALVPGVWISAIGIVLYKTHIIADAPVWLPLAALGACALWGLRNGIASRGGVFRAARDADATLGLKDSLGSALSFVAPDVVGSNRVASAPKTPLEKVKRAVLGQKDSFHHSPHALETTLVPALVADAAGRAQSLDPRSVYSWKFDRTAKVLAVGAVFLVGSLFVPDYPLFASKKELAERTAIMKSGEKLAVLSKEIRKKQEPKDAKAAELNKRLEKLGLKMARGRMSKRAALTQMGELKQQLQKAQQPQPGQNQSQQGGMPQIPEAIKQSKMQSPAGQKMQQDLMDNKFKEAARELEQLADKLEKGQLSQKEKEQAAKDLEEVAKQLRERGGQANENAAKQLEEAAKQLRQQGQQGGQQQQQQNQNGQNQQQQGQPQQQGQQGGQQQGQKGQQQQQGQQGGQQQQQGGQQSQQGQKQQQQGQGQKGQQGGQQQQSQQGQGQQQGQKNGQQQSGQNGQGQNGQQSKSQSQSQGGQNQNQQQGQQGSQSGQQGQSPNGQQGKQGGQGGQGGQSGGEGQQGQSNASGALRDMANALRQGSGSGGGSADLRDMMNNLREAENGTNGGSASGKGKVNPMMGNGNCPGGDCRGLATPGKNLFSTDPTGSVKGGPGLGPRDHAQGNQAGGGVSGMKSTRTGDKRRFEDEWSSSLPRPHSKIDRVKGKWGGEGEVEQLPTRGDGKGGQAHTPYYEVYESAKRDAEDAIGRESVPPAYKSGVKDYFESIKP